MIPTGSRENPLRFIFGPGPGEAAAERPRLMVRPEDGSR